jgi:Asp-tRNA(Asn)/Glu-tRNA(Gln) amidotransferase C subunit
MFKKKKKTRKDSHRQIEDVNEIIQGVSEFDRQTFRADSMIKNKHKTLNTYRAKNA